MAMAYINNLANEKAIVKEAGLKAAEKVHRAETEKIKSGWRWITINPRTKVLIPCDKHGKPTKKGMELIDETRKRVSL